MSDQDPPHGITLAMHAQIAAEIAEALRPQHQILESAKMSERQWLDSTTHWMSLLASDAQAKGAEATLAIEYSDAFARAQNELGPVPEMTPEDWASLTVEIQVEGSTGEPLARRRFSLSDYFRLARHMATRLSANPAEQSRFMARYVALQPPTEP